MFNVKPSLDKVFVKVLDPELVTEGGILIAGINTKASNRAKVVAVGGGRFLTNGDREVIDVKVGDTVIINPNAGLDIKVNDEEYRVYLARDIHAIILD